MSKYILGIDSGLRGGLALYSEDELLTFPIPIVVGKKLKNGKKLKDSIDMVELARMVDSWSKDIKFAIIEQVHAMPNQGVTSMFNFGLVYGVIQGVISANFIPLKYVTPQTWKKSLQVPADKKLARSRATELFPAYSNQWRKAKEDGKAEAAMIALYGSRISQL
jgi:crossover junction endodeoxyribonuclease RuvC